MNVLDNKSWSLDDNSTALLVALALGLVLVWSYQYYETKWNYWHRRGIKGTKPLPVVSELYNLLFTDRTQLVREHARRFGKVYGTWSLGSPRLVVSDPDVARQICIKDFELFTNHKLGEWGNKYQRNSLVWLRDEHWKRVRSLMSPAFTSAKMRRMFKLMDSCADDLVDNFREQLERSHRNAKPANGSNSSVTIDLYNTFSLYTLDGITTCAFGIKTRRELKGAASKTRPANSSSRSSLYEECRRVNWLSAGRIVAAMALPTFLLKLVGFQLLPESQSRALMDRLAKMIEARRQPAPGGAAKHDDLLQMLVDARSDDQIELDTLDELENHHAGLNNSSLLSYQAAMRSGAASLGPEADAEADAKLADKRTTTAPALTKLSDLELLSEASLMLMAGFDTTRSSLSTIVFLLAHHAEVQERLHAELVAIANFQETPLGRRPVFDYDQLTGARYLDAVVSESLRYFNPAPFTDRLCKADYHVAKYDVTIPRNTQVLIGLHAMHMDPDYWPQPDTFDPDRFYQPERRAQIKPGSYAPFSLGPRHCIGMRFSLTETKLALAKVLLNFEFAPAPGVAWPPRPSFGVGLVHIADCRVAVAARACAAASGAAQ